jgi:integrase
MGPPGSSSPTGTAYGLPKLVDPGIRWTSERPPCTSVGSRKARLARIRFLGDELRALRRLQRDQKPKSLFVFTSERGAAFTTAGFARGRACRLRSEARVQSPPQMLRHACGYALANKGHDTRALQAYLGHDARRATRRNQARSRALCISCATGKRASC